MQIENRKKERKEKEEEEEQQQQQTKVPNFPDLQFDYLCYAFVRLDFLDSSLKRKKLNLVLMFLFGELEG
jgi:hypothetical protein